MTQDNDIAQLLKAANAAANAQDFFAARHHLAQAINLLHAAPADKNTAPLYNEWFERMASWSAELNDPIVGLIYLQCLAKTDALATPRTRQYLLQFATGLKKYRLAKKYYDDFITSQPHVGLLLKANLDLLEMMIKLQQWPDAKKFLAAVNRLLDQPDSKTRVEPSLLADFYHRRDKLASFYYLSIGDYENGFAFYEHRHQKDFGNYFTLQPHHNNTPRWQGDIMTDKTLLVAGEQGFGDVFMFCRFLPRLKKIAKHIILQVHHTIVPLLATSPCCAGITIIDNRATPPPLDAWVLIQSLPFFIGKLSGVESLAESYQRKLPYLAIDKTPPPNPQESQDPLQLPTIKNKKLVGLVWATNTRGHEWQTRSLTLKKLLPLLAVPDVIFFSLQIGKASEEIRGDGLAPFVVDMSPHIKNFADTARVIDQLDMVVTVDTAVAHVSGGLMKPTIVLLPKKNDWRWWQAKGTGNDSFWYPKSHRLIRQQKDGDWDDVIGQTIKLLTT
ncbi:MAG: hypothetical protein QM529_01610 [Hydrotalea sp.]|nr:hypothetical protein [Hydrotalea sp.]